MPSNEGEKIDVSEIEQGKWGEGKDVACKMERLGKSYSTLVNQVERNKLISNIFLSVGVPLTISTYQTQKLRYKKSVKITSENLTFSIKTS